MQVQEFITVSCGVKLPAQTDRVKPITSAHKIIFYSGKFILAIKG